MTMMDKINAMLAKEESQDAALKTLTDKTTAVLDGLTEIKAMPGLPGDVLAKLDAIEAQFHETPAAAPIAEQPAGQPVAEQTAAP